MQGQPAKILGASTRPWRHMMRLSVPCRIAYKGNVTAELMIIVDWEHKPGAAVAACVFSNGWNVTFLIFFPRIAITHSDTLPCLQFDESGYLASTRRRDQIRSAYPAHGICPSKNILGDFYTMPADMTLLRD
jgi:hypothetical protein